MLRQLHYFSKVCLYLCCFYSDVVHIELPEQLVCPVVERQFSKQIKPNHECNAIIVCDAYVKKTLHFFF